MASHTRKKPLPRDIEAKIKLLKTRKDTLERLERQIAAIKQECDGLEKEIELYRASVAPIRGCPPEIITDIFEYYLSDNPRRIRRLMLVCRLWRDVAIGTPQFWADIGLILDVDKNNGSSIIASETRFIVACLKYNASTMLRLDVNLMIYDVEAPVWQEILDTFGLLTDRNGSRMSRWKTLNLTFPVEPSPRITDIWNLLRGSAPNLTELRFSFLCGEYFHRSLHQYSAFPNLSALEKFWIGDTWDEEVMALAPDSLKELEINLNFGVDEWVTLNRFRSLQKIVMHGSLDPHAFPVRSISPLCLPSLRKITFIGDFNALELAAFDVPYLDILAFVPDLSLAPHGIPSISPKRVIWGIYEEHRTNWGNIYATSNMIQDILLQYQAMRVLEVPDSAESVTRVVVGQLKKVNRLSSAFKTLRIVGKEGNTKSIAVSTMI